MSTETDLWTGDLTSQVLDAGEIVSAKGLSRLWRVHVNVAKQRMWAWAEDNKKEKFQKIYLIAGPDPSNPLLRRVRLVSSSKLSAAESTLGELTSKHLFAITPKETDEAAVFAAVSRTVKENPFVNTFSSIQNKKCVPRKNAQLTERVKPADSEPRKVLPPPKPKPEPEQPKKQQETETSESSSASDTKAKKTGGGSGKGIAGMFAKAAAKPYKRPPVEKKEVKEEETSPGKENRLNEEKEEEEEAASTRKRAANAKQKLESQPKRKRIQIMADSDSSDDDEDDEEAADAKAAMETEEQEKSPKVDLKSDDEEEEEKPKPKPEPASDSDSDVIPATPKTEPTSSSRPGRRRVRKTVKKTFMDESGFMVTKKEVESCSETDDDEVSETKSVLQAANKKKEAAPESAVKAPAKGKKKAAASPVKGKQSNIMSFFKKK